MFLYIVFLFSFQDHIHDSESKVNFIPITAGNRIQIGSFFTEVPDGCFYADDENVNHVFNLVEATFVPNAVGMYFSTAATWDYGVVVQHFPFQPFTLTPELPAQQLIDLYSKKHLHTFKDVVGLAQVVIEPTYNPTENSFMIGMRYDEGEGYEPKIFIKKIWVTDQDAISLSFRGTESAYDDEQSSIQAIFHESISTNPNREIDQDAQGKEPLSYLELLGLSPKAAQAAAPSPAEQAPEPQPAKNRNVFWVSVLLALGGILLGIMAIRRK